MVPRLVGTFVLPLNGPMRLTYILHKTRGNARGGVHYGEQGHCMRQ
jgi:hypothetical protein